MHTTAKERATARLLKVSDDQLPEALFDLWKQAGTVENARKELQKKGESCSKVWFQKRMYRSPRYQALGRSRPKRGRADQAAA